MFFLLLFVSLLTAIAIYVWRFYENTKRYPKGPRPYPIVGNLLSLNIRKIHEDYEKYSKIYGSIFTVWLPRPYVVITDYELVKEAFCEKSTGCSSYTLCLSIQQDEVNLRWPIQVFIANIINKTLYGFSYEYDNCDRLMKVVQAFNTLFDASKDNKLALFGQLFPFIYELPVIGYLAKGRFEEFLELPRRTIREDIARALKSYSVDQEPECFVQAYYQRMQSSSHLNQENLLNVCMDFFLAGMETTSTTLRWSTLFLAANPDVQDKIRAEILSVIGREGKPTSSERPKLPYT
ncbi:hypothetical protein OSTOST_15319, partial [Ostertagia ostertagi]